MFEGYLRIGVKVMIILDNKLEVGYISHDNNSGNFIVSDNGVGRKG